MTAAARRQARARARRRQERRVHHLDYEDLFEAEMITALIASGALSEAEALRPKLVDRGLARVLVEWAKRWCENSHA